jgi:hypothetical protein
MHTIIWSIDAANDNLKFQQIVIRLLLMSRTITIRLTDEIDEWLEETSRRTKIKKGKIIRTELERARKSQKRAFMRLAGTVSGDPDLSSRKGFSRS